ncbi:MAG TPA: DUF58 domain-containing protein, partial [Pseudolysinimonas sp.]|nr:DUF58 domain-containing protein [Pseudolysinimonas sp.]
MSAPPTQHAGRDESTTDWLARARARERRAPGGRRPQARNLRVRGRLRPTWRGWASLGVGVLALLFAYTAGRREILVVAAAAILLPLVGMAVVRIRRPRFEVVRLFSPPVVAAGGAVAVTLRIRNTASGASTPLVWNDALPWREAVPPQQLDAIPVGSMPRRTRSVSYELHPPRRGVYAVGPLVVELHDPFGMATSVLAIGQADQLVVVPTVFDLPTGGPTLADGEGAAQLVQRRVTGNDDDLTTREYRPGDALRRVHWRASARHGELMVRQEEHR